MLLWLVVAACNQRPATQPQRDRVAAAAFLTRHYAHSRFSGWNVRASARGRGCDVLLIETDMVMEDSMVEAMHYGAGAYGVVTGGVQQFARERTFRALAYKDSTGKVWPYGDIEGIDTLPRCR